MISFRSLPLFLLCGIGLSACAQERNESAWEDDFFQDPKVARQESSEFPDFELPDENNDPILSTSLQLTRKPQSIKRNRLPALPVQTHLPKPKSYLPMNPNPQLIKAKDVQYLLINLGYLKDRPDGEIGPITRSAIKRFQRDNGLSADGIPGKQTKQALLKQIRLAALREVR